MKGLFCLVLFGGLLSASPVSLAQAMPATSLQRANYQIFSGDINGDGYTDVLAKATPVFVPISVDDIPVVLPIFASPTFMLRSNGGSYVLVTNPDWSVINSGVWQSNTYALAFGDFLGNGVTSMMLRSMVAGGDSFTITTPANTIAPSLLQRISATDLGVDIGASGRSVEFRDANRDGRADLVLRTGGRISEVFTADSSGMFIREPGNAGSISAAWNGLRASLDAGDSASAVGFFATESQTQYQAIFQHLSGELPNVSPRWSGFEQIRLSSEFATYAIHQTFNGVTTDYLISFTYENGRWVLLEM